MRRETDSVCVEYHRSAGRQPPDRREREHCGESPREKRVVPVSTAEREVHGFYLTEAATLNAPCLGRRPGECSMKHVPLTRQERVARDPPLPAGR